MKRIAAYIIILSAVTCPAKSNKCCGVPQIQLGINNLQNIQSRILNLVNTIIEDLPSTACGATPITAATIITAPGNYCFANDITGDITISSANVSLNFNGFALTGSLIISGSNSQVYNGTIVGTGSGNGILLSNGISDVWITRMDISNASTGIRANVNTNLVISEVNSHNNINNGATLSNQTNVIVKSSIFSFQTGINGFHGLQLSSSTNALIQNCIFANNAANGFEDPGNNSNIIIQNCMAYQNSFVGFFTASNGVILTECQALSNTVGFELQPSGQISVFSCIAVNNTSRGFYLIGSGPTPPAIHFWIENCVANNNGIGFDQHINNASSQGTFKSCSATNNTGCGFNDIGSGGATIAQYVANYASQNNSGASNYCLNSIANAAPYGPAVIYNTAGASSWVNVFA